VEIPDNRRVRIKTLSLDEILYSMETSDCKTKIIVLDACRENPLPSAGSTAGLPSRGLAVVEQQPADSIIVYPALAGSTAKDGLFTPSLLKYMETPGLKFTEILKRVHTDVQNSSGQVQRTADFNQLESSIYLAGHIKKYKNKSINRSE
jgi:Caspase domain